MRTMARRRAQKRWSALLMRIRNLCLDDRLWSSFVAYAKENYYEAFLAAFKGPALHCVGPVGGSPCGFVVDLTSPDASHTLELLHIDHEQDVVVTCSLWMRALPVHPVSWDDGLFTRSFQDRVLMCIANLVMGRRHTSITWYS